MKLTLAYLRKRVQDEHDAYLLLEELRWGKDNERLACPHCGHDRAYYLKPRDGQRITGPARKDGTRSTSQRRVWKCAACRKKFSVLNGTIFHGTKIPVADWLQVLVLATSAKNGIAAREVERLIGVTPETAWFMLHRIREAMKREPMAGLLSGTIIVDETYIGGKEKNKHAWQRDPKASGRGTKQTPVFSLLNTESGEVRSQVIPNITGATLRGAILDNADPTGSVLHSDGYAGYNKIGPEFAKHQIVDHGRGEYVNADGATTNQLEGYFSQLKRSIDGTHHHVSREHLPRYLAEFDFRYSTRRMNDADRLQRMVDQAAGRRLTYRPLTER